MDRVVSPGVHAGVLKININMYKAIYGLIFLIKGESSHWINESHLFRGKFYWQKRYGAFSVSGSQVKRVQSYIQKQELHHKKETFQEELENFYRVYGLDPKEIDW